MISYDDVKDLSVGCIRVETLRIPGDDITSVVVTRRTEGKRQKLMPDGRATTQLGAMSKFDDLAKCRAWIHDVSVRLNAAEAAMVEVDGPIGHLPGQAIYDIGLSEGYSDALHCLHDFA